MDSLPINAHVSTHPCVRAKLSQLRSQSTNAREVKALINEIATIVGCEALGSSLEVSSGGTDKSPLGYTYTTESITPTKVSLVPILRSGLSMIDALSSLLPNPVPIHHLGMYRSKPTFEPIEYYNNLPYHRSSAASPGDSAGPSDLAIVVDPVIATGATATAAVDTLRDWGVKRVLVICILGSVDGVRKVADSWEGCVDVWCGGCDEGTDEKGMIKPGLGDVGDRLYLTIGK